MKINNLSIGQLASDGASIAEVKENENGIKYYAYIREQEEADEEDESILFVSDMDEDQC